MAFDGDEERATGIAGIATGEGDQIVAVGQIIAPGGGSCPRRIDEGVQALVGIDVTVERGAGQIGGPPIATATAVGTAVIFEVPAGDGSRAGLKVDLDRRRT